MMTAGRDHATTSLILKGFWCLVVLISVATCSMAQEAGDHHHLMPDPATASPTTFEEQDWASERLKKSPRHQAWEKIKNGNREVNSFIVFPEVNKKATAVVVIHEIFGMSPWVQSLTDQLAEAGYIAIAPDLLSGMGPKGGGTSEIVATGNNAVGQAIRDLPPDQITADLNAVADSFPSCRHRTAKWSWPAIAGVARRRFGLLPTVPR